MNPPKKFFDHGTLTEFNQAEFIPLGWTYEESTFRDFGLIYVPFDCESADSNCNVIFVFHGCGGNAQSMLSLGFNDYAATNKMIIVYPDSDCWGYSGTLDDKLAYTYQGMMPTAVLGMMNRVTGDNNNWANNKATQKYMVGAEHLLRELDNFVGENLNANLI